jgi:hypothetical protein
MRALDRVIATGQYRGYVIGKCLAQRDGWILRARLARNSELAQKYMHNARLLNRELIRRLRELRR